MSINTKPSVTGFIATDPKRSETREGKTKFFARFGQPHAQRNEDGTFTQLDPTFSNLVAYGETAEWALENLRKGDSFLAQVNKRDYSFERDGKQVEGEEFIANKISHDSTRHDYVVDRTPRTEQAVAHAAGHEREQAPDRAQERRAPSPFDDPFAAGARTQTQAAAAPVLGY